MANPKIKSKRLTGVNPLAYMGVNPTSPNGFTIHDRAPTEADSLNVSIGDEWLMYNINLDPAQAVFKLVALSEGVATWAQLFPANVDENLTIATDDGNTSHPDVTDTLRLQGGANINTVSVVPAGAGNQVQVALNPNINITNLTVGGIETIPALGAPGGVVVASAVGQLTVPALTNGQLFIGNTGNAETPATLVSGDATIAITNGPGSIDLRVAGAGAALTFNTDNAGPVVPAAGAITFTGLHGLRTSGAVANTVGVDLPVAANGVLVSGGGSVITSSQGGDGQLLIGAAGAAPAWANLQSAGGTVVITNTPNAINLEAAGGGGGGANAYAFLGIATGPIATVANTPLLLGSAGGAGGIFTRIFDAAVPNFTSGNGGGVAASFTAPVSGKFYLKMSVTFSTRPTADTNLSIILNGGGLTYSNTVGNAGLIEAPIFSIDIVTAMTAGQIATFQITSGDGSAIGAYNPGGGIPTTQNSIFITGYLVQPAVVPTTDIDAFTAYLPANAPLGAVGGFTVLSNPSGSFNGTTYTAPFNGLYQITFQATLTNITATTNLTYTDIIGPTSRSRMRVDSNGSSPLQYSNVNSTLMPLNVGDQVRFGGSSAIPNNFAGGALPIILTQVSGFLVKRL